MVVKKIKVKIKMISVLRSTQHKKGNSGDVLPRKSLGLVLNNKIKHNKSKHASVQNIL